MTSILDDHTKHDSDTGHIIIFFIKEQSHQDTRNSHLHQLSLKPAKCSRKAGHNAGVSECTYTHNRAYNECYMSVIDEGSPK